MSSRRRLDLGGRASFDGRAAHGHLEGDGEWSIPAAAGIELRLLEPAQAHIVSDVRADRIRFGFGCYHTEDNIAAAAAAVARALG